MSAEVVELRPLAHLTDREVLDALRAARRVRDRIEARRMLAAAEADEWDAIARRRGLLR